MIGIKRYLSYSLPLKINKRPLLRSWWYHEKAEKQPANGEFDFNSGKGDYFFDKPYFVHQKAEDIYYEQVGWIPSSHDAIDIILLKNLIYKIDNFGSEAMGKAGETVTVPKDIGRDLISICDAMYATPENVRNYGKKNIC
jgi:hypothetical protein